jgi:hypothetical protein
MNPSCFGRSRCSFDTADGPVDRTLVDRFRISPEMGMVTIRRTPVRQATRPQGAGHLNRELISLKLSK